MQLQLFNYLRDPMNYEQCNNLITATRSDSSKLDRWTYLFRREGYIGLDFWQTKDLIQWYPDGIVRVNIPKGNINRNGRIDAPKDSNIESYLVWSSQKRVNMYLPFSWIFISFRYHTLMCRLPENSPINDYGDRNKFIKQNSFEAPTMILFDRDGNIIEQNPVRKGLTFTELDDHYNNQYKLREKPRRRGRYWIQRARNLYVDRSQCAFKGKGSRWGKTMCEFRRRNRSSTMPEVFKCGCRTYRKNIKFRGTVKQILEEPNSTVRTSMIKLYGVDRFFVDAGAKCIHSFKGYKLLKLTLPELTISTNPQAEQNTLIALRMVCPSTNQVYVNLVPPICTDVGTAVDWVFSTRGYFKRITQST